MHRFLLLAVVPLLAALLTTITANPAVALDPPSPDLTGDWRGVAVDYSHPDLMLPAAMSIEAQKGTDFMGQLAIGRNAFAVEGALVNNELVMRSADPGEHKPMIVVRGTIRFIDPPQPDRPAILVIRAEYLMVWTDGTTARGALELVQK